MPMIACSRLFGRCAFASLFLGLVAAPQGRATDLLISLPGQKPVTRKTIVYLCDSNSAKVGLPPTAFEVEYINGSGNNLATVPIFGSRIVFANVSSASGARYAAQQYIWWEAGGTATFSVESANGKQTCSCKPVAKR